MSTDLKPGGWASAFIPRGASRESLADIFPWSRQRAWKAAAPALQLAAPSAEVIEDETRDAVRRVRLRLNSPRRAPLLLAHFDAETEVLVAVVNGKTLETTQGALSGPPPEPLRLHFAAPPAEGIELIVEVRAARPLMLTLRDVSYELPAAPGRPQPTRPPDSMPPPSSLAGETTIVGRIFDFGRR